MFGVMNYIKLLVLPPVGMVQAAQSCAISVRKICLSCPHIPRGQRLGRLTGTVGNSPQQTGPQMGWKS